MQPVQRRQCVQVAPNVAPSQSMCRRDNEAAFPSCGITQLLTRMLLLPRLKKRRLRHSKACVWSAVTSPPTCVVNRFDEPFTTLPHQSIAVQ